MWEIFVNYRTVDARFGAASAYEALAQQFGDDRVFLDHVSIEPGADYSARINAALDDVRVLVVLVGPQWLSDDPNTGIRLIDRDGDWVRREIRHAVRRGITIIPVLLDGVSLPSPDDLPPDVRPLLRCQVVEVRHRSLRADLTRLGDSIARYVPDRSTVTPVTERRRWWSRAVVVLPLIMTLVFVGGFFLAEPGTENVMGDIRTADPCALVDAAAFSRYGETKLEPAYGAFQRCDLILNPDSDAAVDIEVRFDEDPVAEGTEPARWVGEIGIVAWPLESELCDRTLMFPPGSGGTTVVVRAEVETAPSATPLCEVADLAATVAAGVLDDAHRAGHQLRRRSFSADSLAHLDTCRLLGGDALAAVIPGVDVTRPDVGYGNWYCTWSSTTTDMYANLRFDQSEPLDASDGHPTRIGGLEAFVTPGWEGAGSCTAKVVYRSRPGREERRVLELLLMTVSEDEDEEFPVCRMATDLATAAVATLPEQPPR